MVVVVRVLVVADAGGYDDGGEFDVVLTDWKASQECRRCWYGVGMEKVAQLEMVKVEVVKISRRRGWCRK